MKTALLPALFAALLLAPACAVDGTAQTGTLPEEEPSDLGKADGLNADNWTYYSLRPDYRKCMWPMCGGFFVKRVNQPQTKCADGKWAKECYVSELDWSALGLSETDRSAADGAAHQGQVVVRGKLVPAKQSNISYTAFAVSEGWKAATAAAPKGIFYRAKESGIVCITYPCPVVEGTRLNRTVKPTATYAGVDLSPSGAPQGDIDAAWKDLAGPGILVAANLEKVTGPAGSMAGLSASQFYTRIAASAPNPCKPTGCSGQICADHDLVTTCDWKPEYACYQSVGVCELQGDGKCGWTQSDELTSCLANP
ncbi:MAG: DUF6748 domain-containing protein [Polyangiaceae bacterium]